VITSRASATLAKHERTRQLTWRDDAYRSRSTRRGEAIEQCGEHGYLVGPHADLDLPPGQE